MTSSLTPGQRVRVWFGDYADREGTVESFAGRMVQVRLPHAYALIHRAYLEPLST